MAKKLTEEEIAARELAKEALKEARKAEKEAAKARKAAEKEAERVERVRNYESRTKAANEEADKERERKEAIRGDRAREIAEESLSLEERRDKEIERLHNFYDAKLDKVGELSISINNLKVVELLRRLGYYRYDQPGGGFEYVRIQDGKIRLVHNTQEIIDAFEDYVLNLPDRKVQLLYNTPSGEAIVEKTIYSKLILEKIYRALNQYFGQTLPRLRPNNLSEVQQITTVQDTLRSKYVFYNNVVLRITADGTEEIEYCNLSDRLNELHEDNGLYIWENNIIDREYHRLQENEYGEFGLFILMICGGANANNSHALERRKALMSILGYLLHYNFEANLKCVMLTDAKQQDGKPSGGTGKGILGKALRLMLNRDKGDCKYINVNGKNFDPKEEKRYAEGDITTQLIHIEDADRDIDFEQLFFDITEGATFKKLYKDKTTHQVKLMLSTNSPFDISAGSTKRRIALFELDNYFSAERTPLDVFHHMFFGSDWNEDEWMRFDNFMVACCETYMRYGLIEAEMVGYKSNLVSSKLRAEFVAWFQKYISKALIDSPDHEYKYSLNDMWSNFTNKYPDTFNRRNSLTESCKFWLVTYGIKSGISRSTEDYLVIYPGAGTTISTWFVQ